MSRQLTRVPQARIVLAHDYLTQRGGAERVALELARQFPTAPLVTSFYMPSATYSDLKDVDVRPSRLSSLPFLRADPRRAFPLLAPMFSARRVTADVLLTSSSGWAHAIRSSGPKVVYCHNPARWLYQPDDFFAGLPPVVRSAISCLLAPLRVWDRWAAHSATAYLANSTSVAQRIFETYGITARVVHPPSALEPGGPQEGVVGLEPGFFLTVGRRRGYKNTMVVCEAAEAAGERLVVVGGLPDRPDPWPQTIVGVTDVSDAALRWLYAHARSVVAVSREDFGLTPIEGFAFGTPCIALRAGGYLDSCIEDVTGPFVDTSDTEELAAAMRSFEDGRYDHDRILEHAQRFTPQVFGDQLVAVLEEVSGISLADRRVQRSGPITQRASRDGGGSVARSA